MKKVLTFLSIFLIANNAFAVAVGVTDTKRCYDDDAIINPEVALCTTHAYNLGWDTNPSGAEDQDNMRQVVALKATIIAQQMKKQYDYLDATVKRFRIQLQKSVLSAKLEAAGAAPSGSGGASGGSGNAVFGGNNRGIPGAENCGMKPSLDEEAQCLRRNLDLIQRTSDVGQVRRQMEMDSKGTTAEAACANSVTSSQSARSDCLSALNRLAREKQDEADKKKSGGGLRLVAG